jgi:hypothetical protein
MQDAMSRTVGGNPQFAGDIQAAINAGLGTPSMPSFTGGGGTTGGGIGTPGAGPDMLTQMIMRAAGGGGGSPMTNPSMSGTEYTGLAGG